MTQVNTGIPYELFVKKVYEALQRTKDLPHHRNIDIRHNVKIVDQGGIERQFDLYWEHEEFGTLKKSMIECKDYQNGVSIERVDALIGKMIDFPDIIPILATSFRYQSGALQKAKNHHIEIMVVREEDLEKDWKDENGTPLIRSIEGDIIALEPVRIHGYTAFIDNDVAQRTAEEVPPWRFFWYNLRSPKVGANRKEEQHEHLQGVRHSRHLRTGPDAGCLLQDRARLRAVRQGRQGRRRP